MYPKVSVALITYNHEKYIRQALEGVLIQTYKNIEIVVADDCSTDKTMEIVLEYKEKYPEMFKILKTETNLGPAKNFRRLLHACDGDYIALLDGDDFWVDSEKIEIQVNFLVNNQDYALCFHQARILKLNREAAFGEFIPPKRDTTPLEYNIEDVMNDLFMPTASVVYRNGFYKEIPEWFEELIVCDKPLHLINLVNGKIKYINKCMCVYRVHDDGIWSTKRKSNTIKFDKNKVKMLQYFNEYSNAKFNEMVFRAIKKCEFRILLNSIKTLTEKDDFYINIEEVNLVGEKIRNFLKDKKVYVFGSGTAGINVKELLDYIQIPIVSFIDNDPSKKGKKINATIPIISIEEIDPTQDIYIIVGSMYYEEISRQLVELGFLENSQFTMYLDLLITIDS